MMLKEKFGQLHYIFLCFRCARLWRRYAVVWEDQNEVLKNIMAVVNQQGLERKSKLNCSKMLKGL